MKSKEISSLISQVEKAIIVASNRLGNMQLKVSQVELSMKVEFEKKIKGEIDLKLVKFGTGISSNSSNTITVVFCPQSILPASTIEDEFIDALEVIEEALANLGRNFDFISASVEVNFAISAEGKLSVIIGGEGQHTSTHKVKLLLVQDN